MHRKAFAFLASFTALVAAAPMVGAMTMSPMLIEINTVGNKARAQFQVVNPSSEPLPVEVFYERLAYKENGDRIVTKAGDELAIFPLTAMIPPGATQTFRVQWVGSPDIRQSQSFLLTARQLPVKLRNDGKSRIQMVRAFAAILNVAPPQGTGDLKLVSQAPARTPKGGPALAIVVENPTSTHALISRSVLRVGGVTMNNDAMRTNVGIGVVEPGKRRRFLVPLPQAVKGVASLEYRP